MKLLLLLLCLYYMIMNVSADLHDSCKNEPTMTDSYGKTITNVINGVCLTAMCCQGKNSHADFETFLTCEKKAVVREYTKAGKANRNYPTRMQNNGLQSNDIKPASRKTSGWGNKKKPVCDAIENNKPNIVDQNKNAVNFPMCTSQLFGFSAPNEYHYGWWATRLGIQWHEGRNWWYLGDSDQAITYALYLPLLTHVVFSVPQDFYTFTKATTAKEYGDMMIDSCLNWKKGTRAVGSELSVTCAEVYNVLCVTNSAQIYFFPMKKKNMQDPAHMKSIAKIMGVEKINSIKDKSLNKETFRVVGPATFGTWSNKCTQYKKHITSKSVKEKKHVGPIKYKKKTNERKGITNLGSVGAYVDSNVRAIMNRLNKCMPSSKRISKKQMNQRLFKFSKVNTHKDKFKF